MSDPTNPDLFFTVEVHDTLGRPLFLLKCGRVQSITCRAILLESIRNCNNNDNDNNNNNHDDIYSAVIIAEPL